MFTAGLIQGRFHLIHNGHAEYFREAFKLAEKLTIGISDPDPECSFFDLPQQAASGKQPFRSLNPATLYPFTFLERLEMIHALLQELQLGKPYTIVPFPIHKPHLVHYYIPSDCVVLLTLYDDWSRHKKQVLEGLGFSTHTMWERDMSTRITTGTEVRELIAKNHAWQHLVPASVADYLTQNGLDKKLRALKA